MEANETIMWKEISETPVVFENILNNNEDTMKALVSAIKESGKKFFMLSARGTSYHAMMYFKYLLEIKTPYLAAYNAPSTITLYDGKADFSDCVFIGCSQSGMAEDVNENLKRAKEQGAITVAITNDQESLVANTADFHLFCSAEKEVSVAATKTYSAQLFIACWLAAELAEDEDMLAKIKLLSEQNIKTFEFIDKATTVFAKKLVDMKGGFVLSRGITYSIAFEQALKLQETGYKQMKGYASSDFYHGPMAMVDENTPVIIYCAKGAKEREELIRADQKKCIDQMLSVNGPVYLITDDKTLALDYNGKARIAYFNNELGEEFAIFPFAIFAQTLACKVSCGVGNNPDSPRALKKVTVTR